MVSFGIHSISHPKSREIWYSNNVVTYLVLFKVIRLLLKAFLGGFQMGLCSFVMVMSILPPRPGC